MLALLLWRVTRGPQAPPGLVTIAGVDPGEVAARAFELDAEATVVVDAVGSVEEEHGQTPAAYGWILRRDSREPVWVQAMTGGERDRTLVTTLDSVRLEPGAYEVYFASFGATERSRDGRGPLGLRAHWSNDAKFWRLVVAPTTDVGRRVRFDNEGWDADALWSTGAVGNRTTKSTRLRVTAPSAIEVYAVGEVCVRDCDFAEIRRIGEEQPVWQLTQDNTEPAGGLLRNRRFKSEVELDEGIYEAVFRTDATHAARAWRANPPFDPLGWGMRIWADDASVTEFDPWLGPEPVVSFTEVGNDADLEAVLEVTEPVRAVVVSTGEVGSGDTVYDYAWLETNGERVWEMTVDASAPAGGDRTNRTETAFLMLEPGSYTLRYVSDGSHAFGDWRRREPTVPSRWGVSLFPITMSESSRITVVSRGSREPAVIDVVEPGEESIELPADSLLIFEAVRLGNEQLREESFTLEEKTRLRIVAVGEISDGGRYDYGWIESSGGSTVWEMTRRNTRPAGGNDINRMFDGILELDPGRYTVGFKTDFSHAYGDFDGGAPRNSEYWGMRLWRVQE